jgi:hypothetical protein
MSPEDAIDRILELSAEAQTRRREAAENSLAFHKLTGAVLAYGHALDLLTKLRKQPYWNQGRPGAAVTALGYSGTPFKFLSPVRATALGPASTPGE